MKNNLGAIIVGYVFAIGLGVSGMTRPEKVLGFLNLFGGWDPSLMFVMVGAIAIHFFLYKLIRRRPQPLFASRWYVSERTQITPSLVSGSIIFGIGWGLGGYCPGPALVSLGSLQARPAMFVAAMIVGMVLFKIADRVVGFKR